MKTLARCGWRVRDSGRHCSPLSASGFRSPPEPQECRRTGEALDTPLKDSRWEARSLVVLGRSVRSGTATQIVVTIRQPATVSQFWNIGSGLEGPCFVGLGRG